MKEAKHNQALITKVAYTGNPIVYISHSSNSPSPWIIDSSASDHVPSNRSFFSSLSITVLPKYITFADGSKVLAKEVDYVSLTESMPLKSVLFIQECPFNLIPLSQLTRSRNCSITLDSNSFFIHDFGMEQTIDVEHESQGLYYLKSTLPMVCVSTKSRSLLYNRLGHPSLSKL